jgi:putative transposase
LAQNALTSFRTISQRSNSLSPKMNLGSWMRSALFPLSIPGGCYRSRALTGSGQLIAMSVYARRKSSPDHGRKSCPRIARHLDGRCHVNSDVTGGLYFRFPLSLRLVEEMLLERGIVVSYETVRRWARKFGRDYARRLKRKRASRRDIWHLDEVVVTIGGKQHWLWRAVDQDGYILDEIVETRRDTKAAKRLLTRLLKKQGCPPRRMVTDKLGSYAAARRQIMPAIEHRSHKGLNNRAENSHLPLRRRERAMQGFRSPGSLQRFVAVFSAVRNLFVPPRSSRSALATHLHRLNAVVQWKAAASIAA